MKKFLLFCISAMLALCAVTSCKEVKPEFKFNLELTGDVHDAPTAICSDFKVDVCNDNFLFATYAVPEHGPIAVSITEECGNDAAEWLDKYIESNVLSNFTTTTDYSITVRGYVFEKNTGLMFEVDKTFTNRPPNVRPCDVPNIDIIPQRK